METAGVEVTVVVAVLVGMLKKLLQNGVTEMEAFDRAVAMRDAWEHMLGAAWAREVRSRKEKSSSFLPILTFDLSEERRQAKRYVLKEECVKDTEALK